VRVRIGFLAAVLALSVAACGGGSDDKADDAQTPSSAQTRLATPADNPDDLDDLTVPCKEFSSTAAKIADAQRDLFSGGADEAVKTLTAQLEALKDGAPDDVKSAISDFVDAFAKVADMLKDPNSQAQSDLEKLGPKLSESGQKISAYIVSKCG